MPVIFEGSSLGALSEIMTDETERLARLSNMGERPCDKGRNSIRARSGKSPPGLVMPIELAAVLPVTFWLIRDSESSEAGRVIFAISVSVMLWACRSIFQVVADAAGWAGIVQTLQDFSRVWARATQMNYLFGSGYYNSVMRL